MLVYMEGCSEKIGGLNKTVEIDESKFGRLKYHRGHPVKEQWVFGGVERESVKTFLVPDRTASTLMAVIVHGSNPALRSSVITGERTGISTRKVTHRTVNYHIDFVDERTGAHTNTIKSMWRHVDIDILCNVP
jgi:hypothetical protein